MHLFLQMSKLQETTSYFDENAGRVGVKSDTVKLCKQSDYFWWQNIGSDEFFKISWKAPDSNM